MAFICYWNAYKSRKVKLQQLLYSNFNKMLEKLIFQQLYAQYLYSVQIHKQIIKSLQIRLSGNILS